MTDDRSLDRAARLFLEPGPTEAPARAIEAALLTIESTAQDRTVRRPWTFAATPPGARTRMLGAAAAVMAFALVAVFAVARPEAGVGSPSPSPSTSPSASSVALSEPRRDFASDRYGYTVSYPAHWAVLPAASSWPLDTMNNWGSGVNDELTTPGIRFSGAAQALADGQTEGQWLASYAAALRRTGIAGSQTDWPAVTIDGHPGSLSVNGDRVGGGVVFDAVVVVGGVAFNFNLAGNADRATFDALLSSIRLPDLPVLDATFTSPLARYSIDYPHDWPVTPSTKRWATGFETMSSSDKIGLDPRIDGTSGQLPGGTSFEAWFAAYDADRALHTCATPSRNEDITIDGAVGHLDVHCPGRYIEAVVASGGRVYVFTMFEPFNRPMFEAFLRTVRLTPATPGG